MQNNFRFIYKNPSNFRGVFYLVLFLVSTSAFGQAFLKIKDSKKSFGIVKKGEVVKLKFEFTNTGNEPLIIFEVKTECSCTKIEFPKTPILPKETSEFIVIFDTKSVYDRQDRIVEISSNSKNKIQKIRFKGVVLNK
jgi:hypothetical protein